MLRECTDPLAYYSFLCSWGVSGRSEPSQPSLAVMVGSFGWGLGDPPSAMAFSQVGFRVKGGAFAAALACQEWTANGNRAQAQTLKSQSEQVGCRCEPQATCLSYAWLLHCRSEAMGRSE